LWRVIPGTQLGDLEAGIESGRLPIEGYQWVKLFLRPDQILAPRIIVR
jgi:hypothetical protein